MDTKMSSPEEKRLSRLRAELDQIPLPPYPDEPLVPVKNWIAKATPTIQQDWSQFFAQFQKFTTVSRGQTFLEIAKGGNMSEQELRNAWEKDKKNTEQFRKEILSFLDGLLFTKRY
ncbi:MAG: hypothetical protein ABSF61_13605 [Anaerolineales bacterium]